jgi:hypothetical protein
MNIKAGIVTRCCYALWIIMALFALSDEASNKHFSDCSLLIIGTISFFWGLYFFLKNE